MRLFDIKPSQPALSHAVYPTFCKADLSKGVLPVEALDHAVSPTFPKNRLFQRQAGTSTSPLQLNGNVSDIGVGAVLAAARLSRLCRDKLTAARAVTTVINRHVLQNRPLQRRPARRGTRSSTSTRKRDRQVCIEHTISARVKPRR